MGEMGQPASRARCHGLDNPSRRSLEPCVASRRSACATVRDATEVALSVLAEALVEPRERQAGEAQ